MTDDYPCGHTKSLLGERGYPGGHTPGESLHPGGHTPRGRGERGYPCGHTYPCGHEYPDGHLYRDWPPKLAEIAEAVGPHAALRLAVRFGGRGLYVPHHPRAGHAIERAIGPEAFRLLCKRYGGTELRDIPLGAALSNKGVAIRSTAQAHPQLSHRSIAARLRTTERHVRRVLNDDSGRHEQQLNLFEGL